MKNTLIISAAALAAVSCSTREGIGQAVDMDSGGVTRCEVSMNAASVLSGGLQVLVFTGGRTEVFHRADSSELASGTVSVGTKAGSHDLRCLAGGPDVSATATLEALNATTVTLEDCRTGPVMYGGLDGAVIGAVWRDTVRLSHVISRVRLHKVTRRMTDSALGRVPMRLERVFLANAVANGRLDGERPDSYVWRNSVLAPGAAISASDPMLCHAMPVPPEIRQYSSVEVCAELFSCPNIYADDDTQTPRRFRAARLVAECRFDLDGDGVFAPQESFLYPMPLGPLAAGRSYDVTELIITRLGNPSNGDDVVDSGEDDPLRFVSVPFTVEVRNWETLLWNGNGRLEV